MMMEHRMHGWGGLFNVSGNNFSVIGENFQGTLRGYGQEFVNDFQILGIIDAEKNIVQAIVTVTA